MDATVSALPTARTDQPAVAVATDSSLVIELFDQWTGPVQAPGAAFLCWYTRADVAA